MLIARLAFSPLGFLTRSCTASLAQQELQLNLSGDYNIKERIREGASELIRLLNALPNGQYTVEVDLIQQELPALPI